MSRSNTPLPRRVILFGGTTEGRRLYQQLRAHGLEVMLRVATDYGASLMAEDSESGAGAGTVVSGRLSEDGMLELLVAHKPEAVVDATHPYAVVVTQNLRSACEMADIPYLRLSRAKSRTDGLRSFETVEAAVQWLDQRPGRILSTIGSKEMKQLTRLRDFKTRVYARILPLPEAVTAAVALGFKGSHLICMQGPFSVEMNLAMLRQYQCNFLLTKDSGANGGFEEKLAAARESGVQVILVGRPEAPVEHTYEEILGMLVGKELLEETPGQKQWDYFPMFVRLRGQRVVILGGGRVATRRVETLLKFSGELTVVAPEVSAAIESHAQTGRLKWLPERYQAGHLAGAAYVIAATNDRAVNCRIGVEAGNLGLPVSVADARTECSFYFPAIVEHEDVLMGLASQGEAHHSVSALAKKLRWQLNHED